MSIKSFWTTQNFFADSLLQKVYSLAMQDKVLFPGKPLKTKNENSIRAQIHYNEEYRKSKLVRDALVLPYMATFYFDLERITDSQRRKLWHQYGTDRNNIPARIVLSLPKYIENQDTINLKGETWWAKDTNHKDYEFIEIFEQWEIDYEKALRNAETNKSNIAD